MQRLALALAALVVAQKIAHHLQGQITIEIKHEVVEQVRDKLFHCEPPT